MLANLDIKDLIYICVNIIAVASIIITMRNRISILERDCKRLYRIIMDEKGGLHFVSPTDCKLHRDAVFSAIRKGETRAEELTREIRQLNENVLKIIIHLKIDT